MLRIRWVNCVRNDQVITKVDVDRELLELIKKRQIGYLGNILRDLKYRMRQLILKAIDALAVNNYPVYET